jgi:tetratricopeptide (TPR) repeat protein
VRESRTVRWRGDLQAIVDELLEQHEPSSELVADFIEQGRRCDVGADGDVNFALSQLFRIVDGLWGSETAQLALVEALELALASFSETKKPQFVQRLAKYLREHGKSDLSLSLLDRAISLGIGTPVDGESPKAKLLNEMGEVLRETGRLNDAEAAFERALVAVEGVSVSSDAARAAILNNLGLVYYEKGDLLQARRILIESLKIDERLGTAPLKLAVTFDNLGAIEAGLAKAAGPLFISDEYVNQVVDEHLQQAEMYFDKAGELFESGLPESSEDYVVNLINNAGAAAQRGDYPGPFVPTVAGRRETLSHRAFEIAAQGRVSVLTMWAAVVLRGEVLLESGEPDEAVKLLTFWFDRLWPEMKTHDRMSRGLTTLLRASAAVKNQELVESVAETIAGIDAEVLPWRLAGGSEAETRHVFQAFRNRTELIVGYCLPPPMSGIAPSWLYALVLNSKGVLAERQGSAWLHARLLEGAGAELLARVRELRAEVARLDLDRSGSKAIRVARQRHDDAERRLGQVEAQLQQELGPLGPTVPHVAVEEIQARLAADALLLDFTTMVRRDGCRHYLLFQVRANGPVRYKDLGRVDEVDRRLSALSSEIETRPADDADGHQRAAALRELAPVLFDPDDVVEQDLLVSPTGRWGLIPFCVLPDEAGRPLIDNHLVTLIPSGRWIVRRPAVATEDGGATTGPSIVLGDPDFDLQFFEQISFFLSMAYPRLEHTGAEAREIAALLGVAPAVQRAATRQLLLDVRRPRILHVASHGVFLDAIGSRSEMSEPREWMLRSVAGTMISEESDVLGARMAGTGEIPDDAKSLHRSRVEWLKEIGPAAPVSRSALLLAGFNAWLAGATTPPDVGMGMLSAGEFALLDLATTELVVLSACETGVGAVDWADGSLVGLRTAALSAGAASCVSTLWKVGDATAATLMSEFYRQLTSGVGRGSSMRAAQLALREQHPDPYFWAGWVTEGSSGPISA